MTSLRTVVPYAIDVAQERLAAALAQQGFGVLTEIDLQATFAAKLGVDHEPHKILGICSPQLAKSALDADRDVALLLPCTATLRGVADGTEVAILDPEQAFRLAAPDTQRALAELAGDARTRLAAAVASLD